MSVDPPSPHDSRCGPGDLLALVRIWEWEETVRRHLGEVLYGNALSVAFQPMYRLEKDGPTIGGYEAFARFPLAPRVPTRLWFHVAWEEGEGAALEVAAVRKALAAAAVPRPLFLAVNATLPSLADLLDLLAGRPNDYVVDVGHASLAEESAIRSIAEVQAEGLRVAIDDVPLAYLHRLEPDLGRIRPDMVKVDLLGGLIDEPMARFNIAAAVAWCAGEGVELVAERVERESDVEVLTELGVDWAQGYGLGSPVASLPSSVTARSARD